jgi:hypothetical protein
MTKVVCRGRAVQHKTMSSPFYMINITEDLVIAILCKIHPITLPIFIFKTFVTEVKFTSFGFQLLELLIVQNLHWRTFDSLKLGLRLGPFFICTFTSDWTTRDWSSNNLVNRSFWTHQPWVVILATSLLLDSFELSLWYIDRVSSVVTALVSLETLLDLHDLLNWFLDVPALSFLVEWALVFSYQ